MFVRQTLGARRYTACSGRWRWIQEASIMASRKGIIVLMGSGELTATMVKVHQELLARRGVYYKLYQLQFKQQEKFVN